MLTPLTPLHLNNVLVSKFSLSFLHRPLSHLDAKWKSVPAKVEETVEGRSQSNNRT